MRAVFTELEARNMTAMAIIEGLIRTDEPCRVCGGTKNVIRHHPDLHRRPLWTVPLCKPDHGRVHAGVIPDPGTGEKIGLDQRYRWGRSADGLDAAVIRAVKVGRKPQGMPADRWVRELDARGLRTRFEAAAKVRDDKRAADLAYWRTYREACHEAAVAGQPRPKPPVRIVTAA